MTTRKSSVSVIETQMARPTLQYNFLCSSLKINTAITNSPLAG